MPAFCTIWRDSYSKNLMGRADPKPGRPRPASGASVDRRGEQRAERVRGGAMQLPADRAVEPLEVGDDARLARGHVDHAAGRGEAVPLARQPHERERLVAAQEGEVEDEVVALVVHDATGSPRRRPAARRGAVPCRR